LNIHYGRLLRILHWCTDQTMTHALEAMDLTSAQGHIMGFLAHSKEPPCPRDIEEKFQLSHPTVSGILSRLEQKGFIEMRPDTHDRRCKRIYVLPKGMELDETMHQTIRATEEKMVQDFTEEEKAQFEVLLKRAIHNLDVCGCRKKHKEESQG
jgi:DNA-binding MarR family transcriptional regulator